MFSLAFVNVPVHGYSGNFFHSIPSLKLFLCGVWNARYLDGGIQSSISSTLLIVNKGNKCQMNSVFTGNLNHLYLNSIAHYL